MHVYNIKLTVKMENKKKHYDPTKTLPKRKTKPEKKCLNQIICHQRNKRIIRKISLWHM